MKEYFWIGVRDDGGREVFQATDKEAQPRFSGYENVEGPFETEEEAKENL